MKIVELFRLIHDNGTWEYPTKNGDVHAENLTEAGVKSFKATLANLGILGRFRFESQGLFEAVTSTYEEKTIPQYLIDEGVDCDTYEVEHTTYRKID